MAMVQVTSQATNSPVDLATEHVEKIEFLATDSWVVRLTSGDQVTISDADRDVLNAAKARESISMLVQLLHDMIRVMETSSQNLSNAVHTVANARR